MECSITNRRAWNQQHIQYAMRAEAIFLLYTAGPKTKNSNQQHNHQVHCSAPQSKSEARYSRDSGSHCITMSPGPPQIQDLPLASSTPPPSWSQSTRPRPGWFQLPSSRHSLACGLGEFYMGRWLRALAVWMAGPLNGSGLKLRAVCYFDYAWGLRCHRHVCQPELIGA